MGTKKYASGAAERSDERATVDTARRCWPPHGMGLLLVFVAFAVGIITVGYLAYRNYKQHFRAAVDRQLSAIADLKVSALVQWRKERMNA